MPSYICIWPIELYKWQKQDLTINKSICIVTKSNCNASTGILFTKHGNLPLQFMHAVEYNYAPISFANIWLKNNDNLHNHELCDNDYDNDNDNLVYLFCKGVEAELWTYISHLQLSFVVPPAPASLLFLSCPILPWPALNFGGGPKAMQKDTSNSYNYKFVTTWNLHTEGHGWKQRLKSLSHMFPCQTKKPPHVIILLTTHVNVEYHSPLYNMTISTSP
jgi:hypothetical protein